MGAGLDPARTTAVLTVVDDDSTAGAQCVGGDSTLCQLGGRFRVQLRWRDFQGQTGNGHAIAVSDRAGLFWFFDRANVEVLFKMVDACNLTGSQWVFFSATTTSLPSTSCSSNSACSLKIYETSSQVD